MSILGWLGLIVPDPERWVPVCNFGPERRRAWIVAAHDIGVRVKFGYPTSCAVGAASAQAVGMRGIYIDATHAKRASELTDAMWAAERRGP